MIYIVAQFCLECTIFRSCGRGNEIKLGRDLVAGGIIDLLRSSATPSFSCTLLLIPRIIANVLGIWTWSHLPSSDTLRSHFAHSAGQIGSQGCRNGHKTQLFAIINSLFALAQRITFGQEGDFKNGKQNHSLRNSYATIAGRLENKKRAERKK